MSVAAEQKVNVAQIVHPAIFVTLFLTLACVIAYPLVMTGLAQVLFPDQANGSLVRDASDTVVGSSLIAQSFANPEYFHPRPSAAGSNGYDPTSSGASNLGPTNQTLVDQAQQRAAAYRQENGLSGDTPVPIDAVTASASGLDPDISPANAGFQVARVARAHGLSDAQVEALVQQYTAGRTFGILGEPRVNVQELNRALDLG
ncbi:MAG: potassium-transporting ATPase subunit KdpC [Chloroflexi bacterium]|nr:potassium-transporting ATPase subunit KdpC [Chloroflexota bacterium]